MAIEIERKFLVEGDAWRDFGTPVLYRQGYLCTEPERTVRVRVAGPKAFLTIKGASTGPSRPEFEYEIPLEEAGFLLDRLCLRPLIEKERREIVNAGLTWVVDEFFGENAGLIVAEIELDAPDRSFALPDWAGAEVTEDVRYYNANLVVCPYSRWAAATSDR